MRRIAEEDTSSTGSSHGGAGRGQNGAYVWDHDRKCPKSPVSEVSRMEGPWHPPPLPTLPRERVPGPSPPFPMQAFTWRRRRRAKRRPRGPRRSSQGVSSPTPSPPVLNGKVENSFRGGWVGGPPGGGCLDHGLRGSGQRV